MSIPRKVLQLSEYSRLIRRGPRDFVLEVMHHDLLDAPSWRALHVLRDDRPETQSPISEFMILSILERFSRRRRRRRNK